jgi:hypothetical protein
MLIEEIEADSLSAPVAIAFPNRTKLTKMGPTVVPKELMLPAKFKREAPLAGSPIFKTSGLAEVCCNEKPRAMMKNATSINGKDPELTAGIMVRAPRIEIPNPYTMVFL